MSEKVRAEIGGKIGGKIGDKIEDKSREADSLTRISVSLPGDLLQELDERIVRRGYASRSELVRDLIRDLLVQDRWEDGTAEVFGVLTIVYDHHQKDLAYRIMEEQHHRHLNVLCNTHVHVDHDKCLEIIIFRGLPQQIREAAVEIGGLRGVQFHGLTRAAAVGTRTDPPTLEG